MRRSAAPPAAPAETAEERTRRIFPECFQGKWPDPARTPGQIPAHHPETYLVLPRPGQVPEPFRLGDPEGLAEDIARTIEEQGAVNLSPDVLRSAMWHSLAVHGGTSLGGLRAFAIVQKEGVLELPEKSIDVAGTSRVLSGGMQLYGQFPGMGDGDDDMPALVGDSDGEDMPELFFSDSDEEDIHAPPGLRARTEGVVDAEYVDCASGSVQPRSLEGYYVRRADHSPHCQLPGNANSGIAHRDRQ